MSRLCVFCGSRPGLEKSFAEDAKQVAELLVRHGHSLVYGGGSTGQMGILADCVLAAGGDVIGVIPEKLAVRELMHEQVSDMRIVPDMHVRKATMHQLADAYLALPGGLGTLEELFETLCWAQLEYHSAPVGLLNSSGLYDSLTQLLQSMQESGYIDIQHVRLLQVLDSVDACDQWLRDLA